MSERLPHFCSDLCAREHAAATGYEGEWVDTEAESYLDAHPDAPELCDWCDPD